MLNVALIVVFDFYFLRVMLYYFQLIVSFFEYFHSMHSFFPGCFIIPSWLHSFSAVLSGELAGDVLEDVQRKFRGKRTKQKERVLCNCKRVTLLMMTKRLRMILLFEKKYSLARYDYHWLVPPPPFTSIALSFKMPSCVESATLLPIMYKHSLIFILLFSFVAPLVI